MRSVPEWIGKNDTQQVPAPVRLRVFDRDGWFCQICKRPVGNLYGVRLRPECDHAIPVWTNIEPMRTLNRESNLWTLCHECHAKKTKHDHTVKAHSDRIRKKRAGIKSRYTFRGWRRFDGTPVKNPRAT